MKTDEIMALAEDFVCASVREGYMPGGYRAAKVKLRAAIESLAADAARYRWLRKERGPWNAWAWQEVGYPGLDAAIDEAMGKP